MYGPTETTIWSSAYRISKSSYKKGNANVPVPVGMPIKKTEFYLVTEDSPQTVIADHRADAGTEQDIEGELWIGGVGVALGTENLARFILFKKTQIVNTLSNECRADVALTCCTSMLH